MKKILLIAAALTILGGSTAVFAADNTASTAATVVPVVQISTTTSSGIVVQTSTTTSSAIQVDENAVDNFQSAFMDKMQTIVGLRVKTDAAYNTLKDLTNQIKEAYKKQVSQDISAKLAQMKQIYQTDKELVTQARTLDHKRNEYRKQWNEAVKNKDTASMETLKGNINDLTKQIEDLRAQIKANETSYKSSAVDVKAFRDSQKGKNDAIKPLNDKVKADVAKLTAEEKAKNELYVGFVKAVKAKDYNGALEILDQVINAKQQMLTDLNTWIQDETSILNSLQTN